MNVDERIRATLTLEAGSVTPPAVDVPALRARAGQTRRRRRVTAVSLAAAAVAAAVGIGVLLVPHASSEPTPAPRPPTIVPTGTPPRGAVWYDADGLHHGTDVYAVPGTAAPISIAPVRGGAVYLVPSTLHVRYQPWHGPARDIGRGSREANWLLGPGSGPGGTTAAWFDGQDLVMYDTATDTEVARVSEPGRRVMPYYEHEFGTRFRYVDAYYVVWDARDGRVLMYDRPRGRTTTIGHVSSGADGSRVVDWRPDMVASSGGDPAAVTVATTSESSAFHLPDVLADGPVRFSPSGLYLMALTDAGEGAPPDAAEPVLMNTFDGSTWRPVESTSDASVGWGYGNTLMYLQSGATGQFDDPAPLLVYDARSRRLVAVEHRGEVILPAG
jgi:hypothetical protein